MKMINSSSLLSPQQFLVFQTLFNSTFQNEILLSNKKLTTIVVVSSVNFQIELSKRFPNSIATQNNSYTAFAKVVQDHMFLREEIASFFIQLSNGQPSPMRQSRIDPTGIIFHEFGHILNNLKETAFPQSLKTLSRYNNYYYPIVVNEFLAESYATSVYYNNSMLQSQCMDFKEELDGIKKNIKNTMKQYKELKIDWMTALEQNLGQGWLAVIQIAKIVAIEQKVQNPSIKFKNYKIQKTIDNASTLLATVSKDNVPINLGDELSIVVIDFLKTYGCIIAVDEPTRTVTLHR